MYRKILPLFILLISISILPAQKKGLELIHSDKSVGKKIEGEKIRQFEGNVHFRQDTLDMFCDRAFFYEAKNQADFIGNVHIKDGHRDLWADKIEYYPDTKLAECFGNVVINDVNDSLSASYFSFNFTSEKAQADNNLYLYDREHKIHIWGIYGFYNPQDESSEVHQNAKVMQIDSTENDTLIITAQKMEYFKSDTVKAIASDSVEILYGSLRAICDTAIFYPDLEIVWLNHQPKAWYEDNELVGINIKIGFDSVGIRTIDVYKDAKVTNLVDSLSDKWNILKGKEIHMDVQDKKPQFLKAIGNASSVYYLEEEQKENGMNFATSDTIKVYFKESKADSIYIVGGAEGIYYPEDYKGVKAGAE